MSEPTPPLFGELLVSMGLCTPSQLAEALALQSLTGQRVGEALVSLGHVAPELLRDALLSSLGLNDREAVERPRVGELLVRLKHVTAAQRDDALLRQRNDGRRLGEVLVELGHTSYQAIYEALSLQGQRPAERAAATEGTASGRPRVLLVDENASSRARMEEGLSKHGYQVLAFADPFSALGEVSRLQPSMVVSHFALPGLAGDELCRRLKESPARVVPVVLLTADGAESERMRGLQAGADDCVPRGASVEELAARIDTILRRTQEAEKLRKLFARYTSDAVVDEVLKAGEVPLKGEKREVTVLFADLRNFATLAESLPPEDVVAVLNEVLTLMSDAVLECEGNLDKFLGDGVMAIFGAPTRRTDDALRAVTAGQKMLASLDALKERATMEPHDLIRRDTFRALELGVGINTGAVVAGNVGSSLRMEYTVIGDAVNVAARLCALASPGEILVGPRTRQLASSGARFDALNPVYLKGKSRPVSIFRARRRP